MGGLFLYAFFFGTLLFFLPVFVYADLYLDAARNRGWFTISLYHRLRVFSGYLQLRREGAVLHLTKKKAVILPFREMPAARKRFEVTDGFQPWKISQVVELGGAGRAETALLAAFLRAAGGAAYAVAKERYARVGLHTSVLLCKIPRLRVSMQAAAVCNGLVISLALGKIVLEGIAEWMKKRRSTAFWNRRRKSSRA